MKATSEELSKNFAEISDEELVTRIKSGNLTPIASELAMKEITNREIDISQITPPLTEVSNRLQRQFNIAPYTRRILRFPYRAFLGVEPLWATLIFGGIIVFAMHKLTVHFSLQQFMAPKQSYASLITYSALFFLAVTKIWLGISLWRAAKTKYIVVNILSLVMAVYVLISAVGGSYNGFQLLQAYFPSDVGSVMKGK